MHPIDGAAEFGQVGLVRALLSHGADPTLRDARGRTAEVCSALLFGKNPLGALLHRAAAGRAAGYTPISLSGPAGRPIPAIACISFAASAKGTRQTRKLYQSRWNERTPLNFRPRSDHPFHSTKLCASLPCICHLTIDQDCSAAGYEAVRSSCAAPIYGGGFRVNLTGNEASSSLAGTAFNAVLQQLDNPTIRSTKACETHCENHVHAEMWLYDRFAGLRIGSGRNGRELAVGDPASGRRELSK